MEYLIFSIVSMIVAGIITGCMMLFMMILGITDADMTINKFLLFIFAYFTADCIIEFYESNRKDK